MERGNGLTIGTADAVSPHGSTQMPAGGESSSRRSQPFLVGAVTGGQPSMKWWAGRAAVGRRGDASLDRLAALAQSLPAERESAKSMTAVSHPEQSMSRPSERACGHPRRLA
jgi:hypothetical protein